VEKYRTPLLAEGESVSLITQNDKNIFKLLNFLQKEIGENSHTEIKKKYNKNLTN